MITTAVVQRTVSHAKMDAMKANKNEATMG